MTPERHRQIGEIYHSLLELAPRERDAFLDRACGGDEELRREVESLLKAHERAGAYFAAPAMDVAAALLADGSLPSLTGRLVSHYQVLSMLGAGGMGEVYLARDTRLSRNVALKWLAARFTEDGDRVRRFEQESRAASGLNHPNIVTIHDIGVAEGGRFIVMELVEGHTLRARLTHGLTVDDLVRLGAQIAAALRVAHAAGITHRDIKPENIMEREDGYVKVLDFGLARLAASWDPSEPGRTAQTRSGAPLGTVKYMSPEQARGAKVTTASDIFSLGLIFYEAATGNHPFASASALATLNAITSQTPVPPAQLNPQVPAPLERLILRMLAKDERLRPTAAETGAALEDMGRRNLGIAESPISLAHPDDSSSRRHTVGHERERAELRAAWSAAASGRGALVGVVGEPGIGKTTLVEDFLKELSSSGHSCLIARGRCSERLAGTEAYLPWLEILESLLVDQPGSSRTPAPSKSLAVETVRHVAPTWFLHVSSGPSDSSGERLQAERALSQERMKREMRALFQALALQCPLVLFLDDLHWADVSTIDLLGFLADRLASMGVLLLITYRPSDLLLTKHPFLQLKPDLQARGMYREIPLGFLSHEDIDRYLALEFPEHRFPATLSDLIHSKTEGSPLFMADLVRYLRTRRIITQEQGSWSVSGSLPDVERELPESMRGMVERKIAQLGEADMRLLVAASVLGYELDAAVLADVMELDPAEVEDRLAELERVHEFVRLVDERELTDGTLTLRYRFVHVLYQNALYGSLRPTRRAQLSRTAAESLLRFHLERPGAIALDLANLFEVARDFTRAADHFLSAAQNAADVYAYQETAVLVRRGMELLEKLPEAPERDRRELDFLTALGPALLAMKGYTTPEVVEVYDRAEELCERVGDTSQLFTVLYNTWLIRNIRGDFRAAREVAERSHGLAREAEDPALLMMANLMLGESSLWEGEFVNARGHYEQGNPSYDLRQHRALALLHGGYDLGVAGRSIGAHSLWYLGYPDQALRDSSAGLALAEELSHDHTMVIALCHSSFLHYLRRETPKARERAESALSLSIEQGLAFWQVYARILTGRALVEAGDRDAGLVQMQESIAAYRAMRSEVEVPFFTGLLAEAYAMAGRPEEGLEAVSDVLASLGKTNLRFHEAELRRQQGELLLQADASNGEAEACFHQALEIARQQSAKSLELRAAVSLSRVLEKRGRAVEAREMLSEICGWFTEGLDTTDLKEAKALLEKIS